MIQSLNTSISQSPPPSLSWLSIPAAARLSGKSERRLQQLCGEQWLAQGQARTVKKDGAKPVWEIRSDADPSFHVAPAFQPVNPPPVFPALTGSPHLLQKAALRLAILRRWQQRLAVGLELNWPRDQATNHFLAELEKEAKEASDAGRENPLGDIKRSTLYNWQAAHRAEGLAGLVDARSQRRESGLGLKHADPFLTYVRHLYEHENGRSVRWCHDHALLKARETAWEITSYSATKRYLRSLHPAELILRREGAKAFNDSCTPNINRDYSGLRANEVWVADHHQMDVLVKVDERLNAKTGELEPVYARPWLTAWMDCRSRRIMAHKIRVADPATDVIIETWRRACRPENGVPEIAYTDNGKYFDAQVFTGESKSARRKRLFTTRKLHVDHDQVKLGGIYAACQVEHWHAWKFHGQSKPIERFFLTVCLRFAVEFETYCGRSPDDRPAGVYSHMGQDGRLERGLAPDLAEFIAAFDTWLECDYHQHFHRGDGMEEFTGPAQAWEACLVTKRTADPQVLDLMCLPRYGPLRVTADGITHQGLAYGRGGISLSHFGREVCIRPRDTVDAISVWSVDDKEFLGLADCNESVPFHATEEHLEAAIREKRSDTRKLRESFLPSIRRHESVADRVRRRASASGTAIPGGAPPSPNPDPYILQPLRTDLERHVNALQTAEEDRQLRQAVGAETVSIQDALRAYGGNDEF